MRIVKIVVCAVVILSMLFPFFDGHWDRIRLKGLVEHGSNPKIIEGVKILGQPCKESISGNFIIDNTDCSSFFSDLNYDAEYAYYFWAKDSIPYYWVCIKVDGDVMVQIYIRVASFF